MTTTISATINLGGLTLGVSHQIKHKKKYPNFLTIKQASQKTIQQYPQYTEVSILEGLLCAVYDGFFKDELFQDVPVNESGEEVSDYRTEVIGSTIQYKDIDTGELLNLKQRKVEDKEIINLLIMYCEGLEEFVRKPGTKTNSNSFEELKKDYTAGLDHLKRLKIEDYILKESWVKALHGQKINIFLEEVKKMKISGSMFKKWLKRFLDGDFDH
jgi:hypothetical protein